MRWISKGRTVKVRSRQFRDGRNCPQLSPQTANNVPSPLYSISMLTIALRISTSWASILRSVSSLLLRQPSQKSGMPVVGSSTSSGSLKQR